jgi:hypothetical protein
MDVGLSSSSKLHALMHFPSMLSNAPTHVVCHTLGRLLGSFQNLLTKHIDTCVRYAFDSRNRVLAACTEIDAAVVKGLGELDLGAGGGGFGGSINNVERGVGCWRRR